MTYISYSTHEFNLVDLQKNAILTFGLDRVCGLSLKTFTLVNTRKFVPILKSVPMLRDLFVGKVPIFRIFFSE